MLKFNSVFELMQHIMKNHDEGVPPLLGLAYLGAELDITLPVTCVKLDKWFNYSRINPDWKTTIGSWPPPMRPYIQNCTKNFIEGGASKDHFPNLLPNQEAFYTH